MTLLRLISIALIIGGCTRATDQSGRPDFSQLRARSAGAHQDHQTQVNKKARRTSTRKKVKKRTPVSATPKVDSSIAGPSKAGRLGYLRGEGRGTTRHEAVVAAMASVSAQITSNVRASITTREFEDDKTSEASVEQRIQSESTFPYAELIKVAEVSKEDAGFRVIAELDRAAAIDAIKTGFNADKRAFEREVPRIRNALASADFAVLLSQRFNPAAFLRKYRQVQRMLSALGQDTEAADVSSLEALARQVSARRAQARLRIRTQGNVPEAVRVGTLSTFSEALSRHGCQLVFGGIQGNHVVDVQLTLATRDHKEFGAHWVYLGFELRAVAQSDGQVVFNVSEMPEFVHGGGMTPAQAQQAVVSELKSRIKQKKKVFDSLVCVEDI